VRSAPERNKWVRSAIAVLKQEISKQLTKFAKKKLEKLVKGVNSEFHVALRKLINKLARLDKTVQETARKFKEDNAALKQVTRFVTAKEAASLEKIIASLSQGIIKASRFVSLNVWLSGELTSSRRTLRKLKADQKQLTHYKIPQSFAEDIKLAKTGVTSLKVATCFAALREAASLEKEIARLSRAIMDAGRASNAELTSSRRALRKLKSDRNQLIHYKIPPSLVEDMQFARAVLIFLKAADHPHVYLNGRIYATPDFADPNGKIVGANYTYFVPKGWRISKLTRDSKAVAKNHYWSTCCMGFARNVANNACWKTALYRHFPGVCNQWSQRFLIWFPVPK